MLAEVQGALQAIDPNLSGDSLNNRFYQDGETKRYIYNELSTEQDDALQGLIEAYANAVDYLAEWTTYGQADQTIELGVLDRPDYERQTADGSGDKACFNACFRMVANSICNLDIKQSSVITALGINGHYGGTAPDEIYLQAFLDTRFQEVADKKIAVISGTGMSLDKINSITRGLKQKNPSRQIYCIVSLASETAGRTGGDNGGSGLVWHSSVLLGVDNENAIIHDPSSKRVGEPDRKVNRSEFLKRWGQRFSRCHLVVVDKRKVLVGAFKKLGVWLTALY